MVHKSPGSIYWMKTFQDQEVPMETLFMLDVPIPAKKAMELLSTDNLELRKKWDRAFLDHEILESYPDGQCVTFVRLPVSWPLSDRSYVLFRPPAKQVDWYGQDAFLMIQKNAWHPSRPEGADGFVRATNGGNFTILIPDEKDLAGACKMFGLRNNNYNGWLPKSGHAMSFIISRALPASFNHFRECIVEGYNKYFKDDNAI